MARPILVALCVVFLVLSAHGAEDDVRVALFSFDEKENRAGLLAMCEAGLGQGKGIALLERASVRKVLEEQKLSLAAGFDSASMIKVGEILHADLFAYLESSEKGFGGIVVYDARTGIRYCDSALAAKSDDMLVESVGGFLRDASMKWKLKNQAGKMLTIGILSLRNANLPQGRDYACRSLARLLERELLGSKQVCVLERSQLAFVNKERTVVPESGEIALSACLLDIELAQGNEPSTLSVVVKANSGQKELASISANGKFEELPGIAAQLRAKLLEALNAQDTRDASVSMDIAAESKRFADEAAFMYLHENNEPALELAEAAYALDPQVATSYQVASIKRSDTAFNMLVNLLHKKAVRLARCPTFILPGFRNGNKISDDDFSQAISFAAESLMLDKQRGQRSCEVDRLPFFRWLKSESPSRQQSLREKADELRRMAYALKGKNQCQAFIINVNDQKSYDSYLERVICLLGEIPLYCTSTKDSLDILECIWQDACSMEQKYSINGAAKLLPGTWQLLDDSLKSYGVSAEDEKRIEALAIKANSNGSLQMQLFAKKVALARKLNGLEKWTDEYKKIKADFIDDLKKDISRYGPVTPLADYSDVYLTILSDGIRNVGDTNRLYGTDAVSHSTSDPFFQEAMLDIWEFMDGRNEILDEIAEALILLHGRSDEKGIEMIGKISALKDRAAKNKVFPPDLPNCSFLRNNIASKTEEKRKGFAKAWRAQTRLLQIDPKCGQLLNAVLRKGEDLYIPELNISNGMNQIRIRQLNIYSAQEKMLGAITLDKNKNIEGMSSYCAARAADSIFVGTNASGILRFHLDGSAATTIAASQGLPGNKVTCLGVCGEYIYAGVELINAGNNGSYLVRFKPEGGPLEVVASSMRKNGPTPFDGFAPPVQYTFMLADPKRNRLLMHVRAFGTETSGPDGLYSKIHGLYGIDYKDGSITKIMNASAGFKAKSFGDTLIINGFYTTYRVNLADNKAQCIRNESPHSLSKEPSILPAISGGIRDIITVGDWYWLVADFNTEWGRVSADGKTYEKLCNPDENADPSKPWSPSEYLDVTEDGSCVLAADSTQLWLLRLGNNP